MNEFKILRAPDTDIQKWLNQWRHQYKLIIHAMLPVQGSDITYAVIEREPKGE